MIVSVARDVVASVARVALVQLSHIMQLSWLARPLHGRLGLGHAMAKKDAARDIVNELNGAANLLELISASEDEHIAQQQRLFVTFNTRLAKLTEPSADAMEKIAAAIEGGPR